MDKYYTPEKEEICLGFELERYSKLTHQWVKGYTTISTIFEDVESVSDFNGMNWTLDGKDENHPSCRTKVKILDEQDILDCGFVLLDSQRKKVKSFKKQDSDFGLYLYEDDRMRVDVYENIHDYEGLIFTGKIKNKSEFTKLLQQLEIPQKN